MTAPQPDEAPPPFDPDDDLMADMEGSKSAVKAYKQEAARLRATTPQPDETLMDLAGRVIWETSRADEGTISATGANIVARAVLAAVTPAIADLEAAVDRVRRLHSQDTSLLAPGKWCPGCGEVEPCRTIRALRGRPIQ